MYKIKIKRISIKGRWFEGSGRSAPAYGVSIKEALVDIRHKDIVPCAELRKRFRHNQQKWEEFGSRYFSQIISSFLFGSLRR